MQRILIIQPNHCLLIARIKFLLNQNKHISKEDMFRMVYDEIPHARYDYSKCSLENMNEWLFECVRVYKARTEAFDACWTVVKGGEY